MVVTLVYPMHVKDSFNPIVGELNYVVPPN